MTGASPMDEIDGETYCPWLFADEYVNSWQRVHSASEAPGMGALDQLGHCWGPKSMNATRRLPLVAGAPFLPGNTNVDVGSTMTSRANILVFVGSCWDPGQSIRHRTFVLQLAGRPSWRLVRPTSDNAEPEIRRGFSLCNDVTMSNVLLHGGVSGLEETPFQPILPRCHHSTWLFDGEAMRWSQLMTDVEHRPACLTFHSATAVEGADGREMLIVFGGCSAPPDITGSCEPQSSMFTLQWNVTMLSGQWTEVLHLANDTSPWPSARRNAHTVTTIRQTVLMFGGFSSTDADFDDSRGVLTDLWEFLPKTMTWRSLKPAPVDTQACLSYTFSYHSLTDTAFVMCMHYGSHPKSGEGIWIYNCTDGSWLSAVHPLRPQDMKMFRWLMTVRAPSSSFILGYMGDYRTDSVWKFEYDNVHSPQGEWVSVSTDQATPDPLFLADVSQDQENHDVFYAGGHIGSTINAPQMLSLLTVWLYLPDRNTWSALENSLSERPDARAGHTLTLARLGGERVLFLFGGVLHNDTLGKVKVLGDRLWCFRVSTAIWQVQAPPEFDSAYAPTPSTFGVAAYVQGDMIVHGGLTCAGVACAPDNVRVLGTAHVFTPLLTTTIACSGQWSALECPGVSPPSLFGHTAVSFDDFVLIFGGATFGDPNMGLTLQNTVWQLQYGGQTNCSWSLHGSSLSPPGTFFHSATRLGTKMVVSGGCVCSSAECVWTLINSPADACGQHSLDLGHVWLFDTLTNDWTEIHVALSLTPLSMHVTFTVGNILFAVGGMGNATSTAEAQLPSDLSMRHRQYAVGLACPRGTYSANIQTHSCSACPRDTYSYEAGMQNCTACPANLHTEQTRSTSRGNCSICFGHEVCHGQGTCEVNAGQMLACQCRFGFSGVDNCRVPYYYLLLSAGLAIIVLLLVMLLRAARRRHHQQRQFHRQLSVTRSEVAQLTSAWKIDPDELVLRSRLDTVQPGAYGEVWLADYRDMPVAVKRLQTMHLRSRSRLEFEREVKVMRTIRHPNIVLFLGAGLEGSRPFLVVEYMQRGTLYGVLRDSSIRIDHHQELRFAIDIAKGMRYLHGLEPPRIHRDLKTSNLLVSEGWTVKVRALFFLVHDAIGLLM